MTQTEVVSRLVAVSLFTAFLAGCSSPPATDATSHLSIQISVQNAGTGGGTVTSSPAGISCGSTCTTTFASGTSVTLTAKPNANSIFSGWSGACSGTDACTLSLASQTSVTAVFNAAPPATAQLTVTDSGSGTGTVTSAPAGISCGSTCSASFPVGTSVTLTASPGSNSVFAGWTGACTGTGTCTISLASQTSVTATFSASSPPVPATVKLTVTDSGTGTGTVTSAPAGINCGPTCSASFTAGTAVTLTATPGGGATFTGWTGACSGTAQCSLTLGSDTAVGATFSAAPANIGLASLKHIIFLSQENRSFDHYEGALRKYWAQNGYPDQSFDGLPQFNPASGIAPLAGPAPTNPGCNPNQPPPADCAYDTSTPVTSFHLVTQCVENPSPSWNESHIDWDYYDLVGLSAPKLNGFVYSAAHDARYNQPPFFDTNGVRAMGYYDGTDLNYFYFMASNFGTSDRFFTPSLSRTHPNREYLIAGTSGGYVYPEGTDAQDTAQLKQTTIFQELQNAGITWKIYVDPVNSGCAGPPYQASCLINLSYVSNFTFAQTIVSQYPQNIAPISQYFTDLQNGTLPQIVQIEPATDEGFDEHPTTSDSSPSNLQLGAQFVESIINGLMQSSSWKDSAFILTFDESGGFYDHVAPQPTVSPDGIKPVDLLPNDVCTTTTGPTCDFVYTGYRLPLLVVSPYAKKNYVDHTVADTTAILKLIETRFNLPALTKRDAAQPDMTEFFDFQNPPWVAPPVPPAQTTNGPCYVDHLP